MSSGKKWFTALAAVLVVIVGVVVVWRSNPFGEPESPEARIVAYLADNVRPGQPVLVTDLYNNVFTEPEEQRVLERMFNKFLTIPAVAAQLNMQTGRPPTIQELSDQFGFTVMGEMDVLLRIMDADPRLPKFFRRDPQTGEIVSIEVAAIAATPRFGDAMERATKRWNGEPEPSFSVSSPGGDVSSESLKGKPHLLYFWFTGCVPCESTARLVADASGNVAPEPFQIIAANVDQVLELDSPETRESLDVGGVSTTSIQVSPEMFGAFGDVMVYPNMFFANGSGTIVAHLAGPHDAEAIGKAFASLSATHAQ